MNHQYDTSVYPEPIHDPRAVVFTREHFDVAADGVGDDAAALQAAIDLVHKQSRNGIVLIPEGIYRLGRTVHLWTGIRLIGYGAKRPLFRLGNDTPGFQEGDRNYMIHFCHNPPEKETDLQTGGPLPPAVQDGTWITFYSGIDNIDFEIGDGNPAAIAVRYHVSQVCVLKNIDFCIGNGRGAVEDMGNLIENCRFRGGEFGIRTGKSPPDWQNMVLDCSFEGQRQASLITNGARMLVIRCHLKQAPIGILVTTADALYVQDSWFEDMQESAVVVKGYSSLTLQVNLVDISLSNVPYSVRLQGRIQGARPDEYKTNFEAPAPVYRIKSFSHGLHLENPCGSAVTRFFGTVLEQFPLETLGAFTPRDMPALPPQSTWVNLSDLGAKGDGSTDDTDVFRKAIAEHDNLYIPMGDYVLSDTLALRPQTKLIGLHPLKTHLWLKDSTPGFMDAQRCKPLVAAPEDGSNGICGIGFDLGINPGAIGIRWMAGVDSYIDDGVFRGKGSGCPRGEGHAHSIWVTHGGGGIFKNVWMADARTKEAFVVSDTRTKGRVYEMSVEHHRYVEVKCVNMENWEFYALQLEEDRGSEKALGVSINECRNLRFANFVSHRTTGVLEPCHAAIQTRRSSDIVIRGSMIRGAVFAYDNAVFDEVTGMVIPHTMFTRLVIACPS